MQGEESWFVLRGAAPWRRGYTVRRTTESAIEDWEGRSVGPSFRSESVGMEAACSGLSVRVLPGSDEKGGLQQGMASSQPEAGAAATSRGYSWAGVEADKVRRGIP